MNALRVDRHWLLTSTTYGTWLPGDPRGFVSNVADGPGPEVRHNIPGTPYDKDMPGLVRVARENLKCPPIYFKSEQAQEILDRFTETATVRHWLLCAVGIMNNHVHVVVWTTSGSKRKLADELAVLAAIEYVRNQANPLLIWISPLFEKQS